MTFAMTTASSLLLEYCICCRASPICADKLVVPTSLVSLSGPLREARAVQSGRWGILACSLRQLAPAPSPLNLLSYGCRGVMRW